MKHMSIHPKAKKVFSGVIFDVYQWDQKLFDGTSAIFERIKRPDAVRTIATIGDQIIILEDEQPDRDMVLALPGGRIDYGENPLEAAQREFLEETGYSSDNWELFHTSTPSHKVDWTIYTYIARNCKKIGEPSLDPGEKIHMKTVTFDSFIDIVTDEEFRGQDLSLKVLRLLRDGKKEELERKIFHN